MAEHLASIFATEKDRVNCPFYFKIGACRHGDRCSRLHTKPSTSPTLLLSNIYQRPDMLVGPGPTPSSDDPDKPDPHFDNFYEDLFLEMAKYGTVLALNICDNLADHMVGNVYVQYKEEEHAAIALRSLTGRFYSGRPIIVDYSPVTDFREATCRQYEENTCNRGGYCNFMHLKRISRELRRELFGKHKGRNSSRSSSPVRHEEHSHGGRGGSGRRYNDRRHNNEGRGWRRRSISPPSHRRGRSRSPGRKRNRSPVREGSEERRARIEQWNKEREQQQQGIATKINGANIGHADLQSPPDKHQDY